MPSLLRTSLPGPLAFLGALAASALWPVVAVADEADPPPVIATSEPAAQTPPREGAPSLPRADERPTTGQAQAAATTTAGQAQAAATTTAGQAQATTTTTTTGPDESDRPAPHRFSRFSASVGVTSIAAGRDTLTLTPLGVEMAILSGKLEEIALTSEIAPLSDSACERCGGLRARLGALVRFQFLENAPLTPWAALGGGGHLFALPRRLAGTSEPLFGYYATLQFGADLALTRGLKVGPYVSGTLQLYGSPLGNSTYYETPDVSAIEWGLGLRAVATF
jgi:hypothetical protein